MNKELTPLDALEDIKNNTDAWFVYDHVEDKDNALKIIETALKDYEKLNGILPDFIHSAEDLKNLCSRELKELKAFEIAKKVFKCNSLYEHHIDSAYESGWITKEEFDLLKEVLK